MAFAQRLGVDKNLIYRFKSKEVVTDDVIKLICQETGLPNPLVTPKHPDEVSAFVTLQQLRQVDADVFSKVVAIALRYIAAVSQKSAGLDDLRAMIEALSGKNR